MHFACKVYTYKRIHTKPEKEMLLPFHGEKYFANDFKKRPYFTDILSSCLILKKLQFLKKQLYPLMFLGKQLSKFSQLIKLKKNKI